MRCKEGHTLTKESNTKLLLKDFWVSNIFNSTNCVLLMGTYSFQNINCQLVPQPQTNEELRRPQ